MSQAVKTVFRTRNNAKLQEYVKEQEVDCAGAVADVLTVEDFIPAGAFDVRLSARVTTIIVMGGGGATFKVGIGGGDDDAFATGKAKTAGTTITPADRTAEPAIYAADKDLILTANAGTWTSGKIRLCLTYRKLSAPTQ